MNGYKQILGLFVLVTVSMELSAASYDGSSPFLCAVTETVQCDPMGDCTNGPANAVNLPVFLRIDPKKQVVMSAREGGDYRSSKIVQMNTEQDALVLIGFTPTGSWSGVVERSTGKITVTAAMGGVGYIIFGSCMPL